MRDYVYPRFKTVFVALMVLFAVPAAFSQQSAAVRVAVLDPLNTGTDASFAWVGDSLGLALSQAAAGTPGVVLVERARLDAIMAEIELGASGLIDEKGAVRVGGLQGADFLLIANYVPAGTALKISVRLVSIVDGTAAAALGRTGPSTELFSMEEALSLEVRKALEASVRNKSERSSADAAVILERAKKASLAKKHEEAALASREYLALRPGMKDGLVILLAALDAGIAPSGENELLLVLGGLVSAEPSNAEWFLRRALLNNELGDKEAAGRDYMEAFKLAAKDKDIADAYAVHFTFVMADPEKTALALDRAVKGKWGTSLIARFRALHGTALNQTGDTEAAVKELSEAVRAGERSTWVYEGLGLAQMTLGKPRDAAKSLEEAAKIREKNGTGFDRFWMEVLVEALTASGRKADAAAWAKKAGL